MQETRTRIGLFGMFGSGNFGNDGSLEAMLLFLRHVRPDAELVCFCVDPEVVQATYRVSAVPIGSLGSASRTLRLMDKLLLSVPHRLVNLVRAFWHVRRLDVMIIPGTGILDDFATGPFGAPYALFRWCLAARLCGTRIGFVSIGAGPIHHPLSRWFMKSALRMAHYRSYRDRISRDFMQGIGFDASCDPVYPDIASKLPSPPVPERRGCCEHPVTVGIGVMAYYGWRNDAQRGASLYQDYLNKLASFCLWLFEQGHRVRILMGETTDQRAVDDLLDAISVEHPTLEENRIDAEPANSLHDLMRQMAETDVVVATRFHNVVCALKLGRPTVSIGYARKNEVLLSEAGLGEFCQTVENLDVDRLKRQFNTLLLNREHYEHAIQETNHAREANLRLQDAKLISELL
ncbi:polysaccharide pyruvyl transferase family protein [Microvirga massiliensis]|uniref:polysaccharide pyruvyl transferase family protein n=1 Tax=Microvirga massiliensis TaxID=1033741 RepID=UPI00093D54DC